MIRHLVMFSLLVIPLWAQSTKQPTERKDTSAHVRYINPPGLAVNPRFTQWSRSAADAQFWSLDRLLTIKTAKSWAEVTFARNPNRSSKI